MARVDSFPKMTDMQPRVPLRVWIGIRFTTVILAILLVVTTIVWPEWGLRITWKILTPVIPILLFIAPGLWRNICPLAAIHQLPRLFHFTRGYTLPKVVRDNSYLAAIGLFLTIIPLRYVILNESGLALAIFFIVVFSLAIAGGLLFKGKSGWCSQFCPLLPIERIYGQTPFITVRNSHCDPCVGCTKYCFDLNPNAAYLSDLNSKDQRWASQRRLFIGMLPGLIFSFFHNIDIVTGEPWFVIYGLMLLPAMTSLGLFFILDTVLRASTYKLTLLFAIGSLNLYYWYSLPALLTQIGDGLNQFSWPAAVAGINDEVNVAFRIALLVGLWALSIIWLRRALEKERRFAEHFMAASPNLKSSFPGQSVQR